MKIKTYLSQKKLRQIEIASRAGIEPALFSKFCNGWMKLPKKHVAGLCKALNLPLEALEGNEIRGVRK
jgi:transcriptional regulator with XRE-family HTH domain